MADAGEPERRRVWRAAGFRVVHHDALSDIPGPNRRLHFENVDDNATVYLNGTRIGAHQGWGQPFDVDAGSAWKDGGPNLLVVLVENTSGAGGIQGLTTLQTVRPEDESPVLGWKMRGGLTIPCRGAERMARPGSRLPQGLAERPRLAPPSSAPTSTRSLLPARRAPDPARHTGRTIARVHLAQRPQPGPLSRKSADQEPVPAGTLAA